MHGIRLLFFFISTFLRCFGFLFHSLQKFYFILKTNYLADFHRTGVLEKTAYIILYSLFFYFTTLSSVLTHIWPILLEAPELQKVMARGKVKILILIPSQIWVFGFNQNSGFWEAALHNRLRTIVFDKKSYPSEVFFSFSNLVDRLRKLPSRIWAFKSNRNSINTYDHFFKHQKLWFARKSNGRFLEMFWLFWQPSPILISRVWSKQQLTFL